MQRLRIASAQYYFRPIASFSEFVAQVDSLVETASDYKCKVIVFPEYFSAQLLTLGDIKRPIDRQIRDLATEHDRFLAFIRETATKHKIHIVAGTIPVMGEGDHVYNDCYFVSPKGDYKVQGKLHMTRFEREEWLVSSRDKFKIFDTEFGRVAITICYDVEFPELARAAALQGANILFVPSCTDDRQGYLRVRYCAQARAIENQMYVVQSNTVGSIPMVPAVHLNYGQSAIYTPSDYSFARDGILAEGTVNSETLVISELDLETIERSRNFGTVLPLNDSKRTRELIKDIHVETL